MGFLAPTVLFASLGVAVPIAIHLLMKARHRPLYWAAMRFLQESLKESTRRIKFREYILLALRCLVLLLLAFALARPTSSRFYGTNFTEPVDATIYLDASYSLGARDGDQSRFERAKLAAKSIITSLPANSTVRVVSWSNRCQFMGPMKPSQLEQALGIIDRLELTSLRGNTLAAFQDAQNSAQNTPSQRKEVYFLSDFQKDNWQASVSEIRKEVAKLHESASIAFVRCGQPEKVITNLAITGLQTTLGIPHTGARLPCTVTIQNTGQQKAQPTILKLSVDDRSQDEESLQVPELAVGESVSLTLLSPIFRAAGNRLLTATISNDDLPGDNRFDRIVNVQEQIRVLLIEGKTDPVDSRRSSGHFIRAALTPVPLDQLDDYHVQVSSVNSRDLIPEMLTSADLCILSDVPVADDDSIRGLNRQFALRLQRFVREGGHVILCGGENVDVERYNQLLGSSGVSVLPYDLAAPRSTVAEKPFHPAPESAESFLERFRLDPYRMVTSAVDVLKLLPPKSEAQQSARVLLRQTDGQPLIASQAILDGEVIFVATSLDLSWTNWPTKAGSYLSFLQLATNYSLNRHATRYNQICGVAWSWQPSQAQSVAFSSKMPSNPSYERVLPNGRRESIGIPSAGTTTQRLTFQLPAADIAGVYQVVQAGSDKLDGPRWAATPDLRESADMTVLTDAEITEILGLKPLFLSAEDPQRITESRGKSEWTLWFLLAVTLIAMTETLWAWYCGKAG